MADKYDSSEAYTLLQYGAAIVVLASIFFVWRDHLRSQELRKAEPLVREICRTLEEVKKGQDSSHERIDVLADEISNVEGGASEKYVVFYLSHDFCYSGGVLYLFDACVRSD
jgi:hypothetical protein